MSDEELKEIYRSLRIVESHILNCKLQLCKQPELVSLEVVDIDLEGRPFILQKNTAAAWRTMKAEAFSDEITLLPVSGFRSYIYQKQIIERKLAAGRSLETILTETAIPGYSEHHSGRAIDISNNGEFTLNQEFENTSAYVWLVKNARRFHFRQSYPRNNEQGIIFEPWHWYYEGD
jgi:zinc D-Ala-D-Ala carboxypeptidase